MMAGRGGVKARVDADEKDREAGSDDVADAAVRRGGKLGDARPA